MFSVARGCVAALAFFIAVSPIPSRTRLRIRSLQSSAAETDRWDKLTQEATDTLVKYIRINTTNPPGNEMEAAKFLKEKFLSEGIPRATTWEPEPGRGIVAARLRGMGEKKTSLALRSIWMSCRPSLRNGKWRRFRAK